MKKKNPIIALTADDKKALKILKTRPEFGAFIKWIKVQQNNIAVLEWFRIKSTDVDIALKKAKFEGQFEILKAILDSFANLKEEEDE